MVYLWYLICGVCCAVIWLLCCVFAVRVFSLWFGFGLILLFWLLILCLQVVLGLVCGDLFVYLFGCLLVVLLVELSYSLLFYLVVVCLLVWFNCLMWFCGFGCLFWC